MIIASKIKKIIVNPSIALSHATQKIKNIVTPREYVAASINRSDSEDGLYLKSVSNAVERYKFFKNFKRDLNYTEILEHVTKEHGQAYLNIIKENSPDLLEAISSFKDNDIIGNPKIFDYSGIGKISPTTLRYIKVSSDLRQLFGIHFGDSIIEIGGGYGGQALILDKIFKIKLYELLDLPPVLKLISKYLESHILNCAYKVSTLNQKTGEDAYDLVISNYAFSELPKHLQQKYIEKVLCKCKRGYLTMNSGRTVSSSEGKLRLDELKELLPPFDVLEETPLTSKDNYIVVWGHQKLS
jgi:putative sugar O-methyltransferase